MTDTPKEVQKCSISWCGNKALANHLCKKHYRRQRRKLTAVHLTHPDVKGVLDSAEKVLVFTEALVIKAHKANGHKTPFEGCDSGSCKEYHSLVQLFASKEEASNVPTSTPETA